MRRVAVLVTALTVLTGCGDDPGTPATEPAASVTSATDGPDEGKPDKGKDGKDKDGKDKGEPAVAPAGTPACAAVWRDGTRLARDYEGCRVGRRLVAPDQEPCSFGQRLVRYGDHFYAVRGGPVNRTEAPLEKDRDYRGAVASCRA